MKTQTDSRMSGMAFCLCMLVLPTILHAQGSWSTASSDGFTKRLAAAASEVGGNIYVMGGLGAGNSALNALEVFEPSSNWWSTPSTTGTFTARYGLSSAEVDGKIYVMGGATGVKSASSTVNLLEVFDPKTNVWSTPTTTGTFTPRYSFASAAINGKIYVMGGSNNGEYVTTVEVYDPSTNNWSAPSTTGAFTGRVNFTSCVVNNKIYTFGGVNGTNVLNTLEVFDPLTNSWSTPVTTGTCTPRRGAAIGVLDGRVYVIGGYDYYTQGGNYLNTLEVFDPSTNFWTTLTTGGNLTPRYLLNATTVNGRIYAMGGANGSTLNTNEVFTPSSGGIQAGAASHDFELSPNPTNGMVKMRTAEHGTIHIAIANMLGERVMELSEPAVPDFSIDLSKLPAGVYFVRISGDGSTTTRMIVRE